MLCWRVVFRYLATDDELLVSEMITLARNQFADLNMENYPPTDATDLAMACKAFVKAPGQS